jgi:peroxiredoxin
MHIMQKTTKRALFIAVPVACLVLGAAVLYYLKRSGPYYLPDITLETLDGHPVALNSFRGKPTLVVFWASTCSTCLEELPSLINLYNTYSRQGLEILGIVIYYNDPLEAEKMVKHREIPYRILLDQNKKATYAFGNVHLTPTTFLISPQGKIVYRQTGKTDFKLIQKTIKSYLTKQE